MSSALHLGLVIGSGSVRCAAALGLWKVLQRAGIKLDIVVGCSGGSIFATGIAFEDDLSVVENATLSLWTEDLMAGYTANLRSAMTGEIRFTERSGLVDGDAAAARIATYYQGRTLEAAKIPLHIVATDFMTGEGSSRGSPQGAALLAEPITEARLVRRRCLLCKSDRNCPPA